MRHDNAGGQYLIRIFLEEKRETSMKIKAFLAKTGTRDLPNTKQKCSPKLHYFRIAPEFETYRTQYNKVWVSDIKLTFQRVRAAPFSFYSMIPSFTVLVPISVKHWSTYRASAGFSTLITNALA
jgi:hypothetical protein